MRRLVIAAAVAAGLALSGSGAVLADHEHELTTPGTTVSDIARGQTAKCGTEPGGHQFHAHVHTGTPGTFAFEQPNNPVEVGKTENATC